MLSRLSISGRLSTVMAVLGLLIVTVGMLGQLAIERSNEELDYAYSNQLAASIAVGRANLKLEIARILKDEGYISDYSVDTSGPHPRIKITNKIVNRSSAIAGLRRVSRPGLRRYVGADEIPRVLGGMGLAILSTSRGVLSGREARKQKVGGELLAYVW